MIQVILSHTHTPYCVLWKCRTKRDDRKSGAQHQQQGKGIISVEKSSTDRTTTTDAMETVVCPLVKGMLNQHTHTAEHFPTLAETVSQFSLPHRSIFAQFNHLLGVSFLRFFLCCVPAPLHQTENVPACSTHPIIGDHCSVGGWGKVHCSSLDTI